MVRISDRIAYINHDIDDALRAGIITENDLPGECCELLGNTHGQRINSMIMDVIQNSTDKPKVGMSSEVSEATEKLRSFMFERVYMDDTAKKEEKKAGFILERLFQYFMEYPGSLQKNTV